MHQRALDVAEQGIKAAAVRAPTALKSTADCYNRRRDKAKVEEVTGLLKAGDEDLEIVSAHSQGLSIASGYRWIVYGDHGPYL